MIVWIGVALSLHASQMHDPYEKIRYFKLDNGMQVYMLADPKAETTRLRVKVGVGFDNETDETYGLSHLVEHLLFRDSRIPHRDYVDYFTDEGATYINGYTQRYETDYVATVPSEKSYWAVENFATMLFDKNVTEEDLEIERKALQTEIGEPHWYYRPLYALMHFFEFVTPPKEDFFVEEFGLPKDKALPDRYHAQENNKRFTLDEVLARYKTYYYPANMTLTVVGGFDPDKMRETIEQSFGKIARDGSEKVREPHYAPKLNRKPYVRFYEGMSKNYAYIGAKYLLDDYKKYLILGVYMHDLAQRLQRELRNKHGKTYGVSENGYADKNAGVAMIGVDGLPDVFAENIAEAKKMIERDRKGMSRAQIAEAMALYEKKYYSAVEHDSDTLMDMADTAEYLRTEHNITDRTSYAIFKSITPEEFQKTVREIFSPENRYEYVSREYYFFPMDTAVLGVATLLLFIVAYFFFARWLLRRRGIVYTHREVVFQRRLSSRFTGFLIFAATSLFSAVTFSWLKYLLFKWVAGDPRWLYTVDVPYSYLLGFVDALGYIVWFLTIYYLLWRYYARLIVLKAKMLMIGNRIAVVDKDQIEKIDVVAWRARKKGAVTYGTAWRFWKPLTEITCKDGRVCYLRSANARHLEEDLESWLHRT